MKYKLKVVCMYCKSHIRTHEVKRKEEAGISHGICDNCKGMWDKEIERMKK